MSNDLFQIIILIVKNQGKIMNKLSLKKVISLTVLFIGAFALSVFASSWSPAGGSAPGFNSEGPIDEGAVPQTKTGALTIGNGSQNPNGSVLDTRGLFSMVGLYLQNGMAAADTVNVLNKLIVKGVNSDKVGYLLTNNGTGVVGWKAPISGGITLSEVKFFPLNVIRYGGRQTLNTPTTYLFCGFSRISSEMFRVNAGDESLGYCKIDKNTDGTWRLRGYLADDPDFRCEMVCFK